ncbi:MAG: LptF/LptG family permease, partial [bacterium]
MPAIRRLDRYVFAEFWKLVLVTAMGFPVLLIISDLATRIEEYLSRNLTMGELALSYVYMLPDSLFMALPAAVLFATVFSLTAMSRNAELTAAKASGLSFYRLAAPIFVGALIAVGLDVALGAAAPSANQRRSHLIKDDIVLNGTERSNFVFAGEFGRVYKARDLHTDFGRIRGLQIERKGTGADYPTYLLTADSATFDPAAKRWSLAQGNMNLVGDSGAAYNVSFGSALDKRFIEAPSELMAKERLPHDLSYSDLTRIIAATERSGSDANLLRVERALKLAIPATCLIIALFGAPLATSTERGGSAWGVAVSLATTLVFLMMIQLTRA